ncbi:MAG: Ribokinase [Candidatus Ozemobacter sibiricus]|jgi:sugar/nucleoside kinase (ribokinase family)|uniref:Ribokinase n=1 Tax=Candidatus Ozemobacter sibiricus TaxID=2268124 RepID=A0A367ZS22_9BACT|nr:MAG: Ribokinase [Candidatus Ozemobacter sibiricus]
MTVKMIVVGSVAYDTLKTPKGTRERALGGSATYFATVASYFTKVGLVGVAGEDFEAAHINFLKKHGVDLAGFEQVPGQTFHWSGSYGEDFGDATTHSTCLNVFESFDPKLPPAYQQVEFLFLANIHPALQMKVIQRVKKPRLIGLDTMNFWITSALPALKKVLKKVDVLFLNHQEALMLSGEKKLNSAVPALLKMGPQRLVIKMGELGALTATARTRFFTPAFPLSSITDPTGAGDSFAGGFMGTLARTGDLTENGFRRAMLYGSAMGAFTCEKFSLDTYKTLTRAKIEARFKALKAMLKVV